MTMTDTIAHLPPERTATAAELADHAARMERARSAACEPLPEACSGARLLDCPQCHARHPAPCTLPGSPGFCLARIAAARAKGLISEAAMEAALYAAGPVFTAATIIRAGAQ
jgi:hypothetical protein